MYSTLIFPGGGHFLLQRRLAGALFAAVAGICFVVLMVRAFEVAQSIADRILLGEIPLDYFSIRAEISIGAITAGSNTVSLATWTLVACWAIAGIDAFRLGRREERRQTPAAEKDA